MRGKREDAVKCALTGKHYALALLIASVCDHSTYHAVARCYVDKALAAGSPLHTVAALFANQMESADMNTNCTISNFWKDSSQNLSETWRHHLASILSNQTQGWKKIVVALGDKLLRTDKCHAAHFCYLVAGCPVTSETDPSSRLVLLGCDHRLAMHQALVTNESIEAYKRTEALEWAKRKGNPNAVISALQTFKLKYATILADYGLESTSKEYTDSIRKCTGISNTVNADSSLPYPSKFAEDLTILEDRLCLSMGIKNERPEKKSKVLTLPWGLSKIVGSGKSSAEPAPQPAPEIDFSKETNDVDDMNLSNLSFASAKTNLVDITAEGIGSSNGAGSKVITSFQQGNDDSKEASVNFDQPKVPAVSNDAPKQSFVPFPQPEAPVKTNDDAPKQPFMPFPQPEAPVKTNDDAPKQPFMPFQNPMPETPAKSTSPQTPVPKQPNKVTGSQKVPDQPSQNLTKGTKEPPKSAPVQSSSSTNKDKDKKEQAPGSGNLLTTNHFSVHVLTFLNLPFLRL